MKDMHDLEVYAPIKGYNGYLITSHGRILSLKGNKMRELKQGKIRSGYMQVDLCKNGKRYHKLVHRLVAQAFIINDDNKPCINHIDENKTNNHVSNLEWCTHKENNNHATRNERVSKANTGKKLSEESKRKISKSLIGKKHTEERKQNFSNSRKGSKNPRARAVIGFKIEGGGIKYYKFMSECKNDGFDCSTISKCCKNEKYYNSHKGYVWYYADDFFNRKDDNQ